MNVEVFAGRWRTLTGATFLALAPGLAAAQACPDYALTGAMLSFDISGLGSPQTQPVVAGGEVNLSLCQEIPGVGYVAAAPDFELTLSGNAAAGQALTLSATGECDIVLLANDASGQWHFNDDANGTDPAVTIPNAPDGIYDIWIGTYDPATCNASFTLQAGAGAPPPPPPPPAQCPDWSLDSPFADRSSDALVNGETFQVSARGGDISGCPEIGGYGFFSAAPGLELNLTGNQGRELVFSASAMCDTVMIVNDPTGAYLFNDDAVDLNPEIRIPAAADGVYDIWVGGYESTGCDASLTVRTIGGAVVNPGGGKGTPAPAPQPQPQPQPPAQLSALPASGHLMDFRNAIGQTLSFEVTGSLDGRVWGSDVYTGDSTLATAAVHAGVLAPGQTGIVTVVIEPGRDSYQGSDRNGVSSVSYGSWSLSYRFVAG